MVGKPSLTALGNGCPLFGKNRLEVVPATVQKGGFQEDACEPGRVRARLPRQRCRPRRDQREGCILLPGIVRNNEALAVCCDVE